MNLPTTVQRVHALYEPTNNGIFVHELVWAYQHLSIYPSIYLSPSIPTVQQFCYNYLSKSACIQGTPISRCAIQTVRVEQHRSIILRVQNSLIIGGYYGSATIGVKSQKFIIGVHYRSSTIGVKSQEFIIGVNYRSSIIGVQIQDFSYRGSSIGG